MSAISTTRRLADAQQSEQRMLAGIRALLITSGHRATDPRVYAREACGLADLGAEVAIAAMHDGSGPNRVRIIPLAPPSSRLARFLWQPWRCVWAARDERPHIVHFQDAEMLVALPLMKLLWFRSKFVYDV